MLILGIETSCDETAISIIETLGEMKGGITIDVRANVTLSQVELHRKYGGVFPNMAKREHSKQLIPLLKTALAESNLISNKTKNPNPEKLETKSYKLKAIFEREPELLSQFLEFIPTIQRPLIDVIAVTEGPGLEPCLWTGINFAKALSLMWDIPIVPVNHMEGHIFSALLRAEENPKYEIRNPKQIQNSKSEILSAKRYTLTAPAFPALALLISGGHTELVLIRDWFKYEIIGQTRDDAVGEAFDKVARLLGLPYPGGPEISRLAEEARAEKLGSTSKSGKRLNLVLPRPMLHSNDFDFSFSGLKTAVLYLIKKIGAPDKKTKAVIAREFEDAITEVLISKTKKAIEQFSIQTLLIGGGVIANTHIRRAFDNLAFAYGRAQMLKGGFLHIPEPGLTTDNALMIAVAGYFRYMSRNPAIEPQNMNLTAKGNLKLDEK